MIVKWAIWGGVIGFLISGFNIEGAVMGAALGVVVRKWLFRTFWQ